MPLERVAGSRQYNLIYAQIKHAYTLKIKGYNHGRTRYIIGRRCSIYYLYLNSLFIQSLRLYSVVCCYSVQCCGYIINNLFAKDIKILQAWNIELNISIQAENLPEREDCKPKFVRALQSNHRAQFSYESEMIFIWSLELHNLPLLLHIYSNWNYTELRIIRVKPRKPLFTRVWRVFSLLKCIQHN